MSYSTPEYLMGIHTLTNSTLGIKFSTFSLQDALDPSGYDSLLPSYEYDAEMENSEWNSYMFEEACGPQRNCTDICTNKETAFGSLDNLRNCVAYPTIADGLARNVLTNDSQRIANILAIEKSALGDDVSNNVVNTIHDCLTAYCTQLTGCMAELKSYNESYPEYSFLNKTSTFYFTANFSSEGYFDMCEYLPADAKLVEQDIGGIGVYISYWIQIGIALIGFLGVFIFGPGIHYACIVAFLPRHGFQKAKQKAHNMGLRLRRQRLPCVATALTDFQKAQCFFMLAINFAALVDKINGNLQPTSLQQLYNTYVLTKSVSISGFLPITFNLFTLHLVDMVSWYLLILSFSTIAVATGTLFALGTFDPSPGDLEYLSRLASSGGPAECGGWVPGAWCYVPLGYSHDDYYEGYWDPSNGAYSILAFCLVVFVLLILYQIRSSIYALRRPLPRFPRLASQQRTQAWSAKKREIAKGLWDGAKSTKHRFLEHQHTRRTKRWMSEKLTSWKLLKWLDRTWVNDATSRKLRTRWLVLKEKSAAAHANSRSLISELGWRTILFAPIVLSLYIVFFALYMNFFQMFCVDLAWFSANGVDTHTWSFGQIVAITVWAAPVCEYVHLEMRGMRRGFDHRLLAPYRLTSKESTGGAGSVRSETSSEVGFGKGEGAYEEVGSGSEKERDEGADEMGRGGDVGEGYEMEYEPPRREWEEEEEDIAWQLPEMRRSESIRLYDVR